MWGLFRKTRTEEAAPLIAAIEPERGPSMLKDDGTVAGSAKLFTASETAEKRRAVAWLEANLQRGRREVFVIEKQKFTPEMAELLLERNPGNRKVVEANVANIARDISEGRFRFNGETLKISKTGELNDGQHRCLAVVMAGTAIETIVVFGLERESRETVDQGAKRTAGHILGMNSIPDANVMGNAARLVWQITVKGGISYGGGGAAGKVWPTRGEIIECFNQHPKLLDSVTVGRKARKAKLGSIGLHTALHYLFSRKSAAMADEFYGKLCDGIGFEGKTDPAYVLRRRLQEHTFGRDAEIATLTVDAWNATRAGETVKMLKLIVGRPFPRIK